MVKLGLCCLLRGLSCGLSANKFESGLRSAEAWGGGGLGETSRCRCRASLCQSLGLKAFGRGQPETAEGVSPNQGKTGKETSTPLQNWGPLPRWVSKPLPGLRRSRSFRGSEIRSSGRRPARLPKISSWALGFCFPGGSGLGPDWDPEPGEPRFPWIRSFATLQRIQGLQLRDCLCFGLAVFGPQEDGCRQEEVEATGLRQRGL